MLLRRAFVALPSQDLASLLLPLLLCPNSFFSMVLIIHYCYNVPSYSIAFNSMVFFFSTDYTNREGSIPSCAVFSTKTKNGAWPYILSSEFIGKHKHIHAHAHTHT